MAAGQAGPSLSRAWLDSCQDSAVDSMLKGQSRQFSPSGRHPRSTSLSALQHDRNCSDADPMVRASTMHSNPSLSRPRSRMATATTTGFPRPWNPRPRLDDVPVVKVGQQMPLRRQRSSSHPENQFVKTLSPTINLKAHRSATQGLSSDWAGSSLSISADICPPSLCHSPSSILLVQTSVQTRGYPGARRYPSSALP